MKPHSGDTALKATAVILLVLTLAWAFVHLGSEMLEGETLNFDLVVLHAAQQLRARQPWLAEVMRDCSGLGSTVVLTLFTSVTVGYMALFANRVTACMVAASVVSGTLLVSSFKMAFGRLRPDSRFADSVASGLSFPSGHSSMSAIVFLTLGMLLANTRQRWQERAYIVGGAASMTVLVGVSRAGMGVHWATDVFGGWAFGIAWALVWLLAAKRLDGRWKPRCHQ
jgi:undecaprenyl-diphosphatase